MKHVSSQNTLAWTPKTLFSFSLGEWGGKTRGDSTSNFIHEQSCMSARMIFSSHVSIEKLIKFQRWNYSFEILLFVIFSPFHHWLAPTVTTKWNRNWIVSKEKAQNQPKYQINCIKYFYHKSSITKRKDRYQEAGQGWGYCTLHNRH